MRSSPPPPKNPSLKSSMRATGISAPGAPMRMRYMEYSREVGGAQPRRSVGGQSVMGSGTINPDLRTRPRTPAYIHRARMRRGVPDGTSRAAAERDHQHGVRSDDRATADVS